MENRKRGGIDHKDENQKKFYKPVNRPNKEDFVFGVQSVLETLRSDQEIDKIILQKEIKVSDEIEALARHRGVPIQKVPLEKLNRITMKNHQGAVAFVSPINFAKLSNIIADVFEKGEMPLVLILDRVTDVRNFGAICRSAECCGVHALVLPTRGGAQLNGDAMKTSSGALNFIPVCRENDLAHTVSYLKNSGFQVFACTEKTNENMYEADFSGPTAIVMGSEEDGISDIILNNCDKSLKIPLKGKVGSLNVSVASAVMLYEVVRQRDFK